MLGHEGPIPTNMGGHKNFIATTKKKTSNKQKQIYHNNKKSVEIRNCIFPDTNLYSEAEKHMNLKLAYEVVKSIVCIWKACLNSLLKK